MAKYWIVGAWWEGEEQDQRFVEEGMWILGKEDGRDPKRAAKMQRGDRIAIKRLKGRGRTGLRILHLGIIKGVNLDTNCVICTVDWVATNLNRNIGEGKGCFGSVHGPYKHDSWIQEIFCL